MRNQGIKRHGGKVIPPLLNPASEEMCEIHAKKS